MKNKIILLAISFFSFYACKKEVASTTTGVNIIPTADVPVAVVTSFNTSFNTASEIEWQHNTDNSFVSQFNMDNERHEADFDGTGHESSHHVICLDAAVPAVVLNAFRASFATDNVYEWNFTNNSTWKAHFMRAAVKWEVTFDAAGTIIKSEHD